MQLQTGSSTAINMTYPSLPASPTLTNPDMILPYGEYDSTPSPPQNAYRPPSPGDDWSRENQANMQFSIGPPSHMLPMTPTTPIIYGNGTMLSDIGEVTEAESTPGRNKLPGPAERRMLKKQASLQGNLRSNPAYSNVLKRAKSVSHERKVSVESTSTVTSEGQAAEMFKDFDDQVSVDDSVFQGDDEESVADSHSEMVIAAETERLSKKEVDLEDEEDRNSSAALSRRAEQILLNAKRRLNNMEGNLTRARSTLHMASGSISSISSSSPLSRGTPSPQVGQLSQTTLYRQHSFDSPMASPGHSRVYSENSISRPAKGIRFPVRSASAAARYRGRSIEDLSKNNSPEQSPGEPKPEYQSQKTSPRGVQLEPLSENEVVPGSKGDKSSVRSSIIDDGYQSAGSEVRSLSRSASRSQMRELQTQMSDLKGRLSVLRDRARDDSMKRRSMQSLRTPSPFTAAEQWYTGGNSYTSPGLSTDAGIGLPSPPINEDNASKQLAFDNSRPLLSAVGTGTNGAIPGYASSDVTSVYEDVAEERPGTAIGQAIRDEPQKKEDEKYDTAREDNQQPEIDEESIYSDELVNHDELDDYDSDASLYHDTIQVPISHEDREDAFDYEHFFLHSAMGTIPARNGRRGSFSSEDSVETTVPGRQTEKRPSLTHLRSESTDSVSSINTFATATEGRGSDSGDEDRKNYAVQPNRPTTPMTAKRSTFGSPAANGEHKEEGTSRRGSVIHDPVERNGIHRPASNASFGSTGTTRSFPLINKPKSQISLVQKGTTDARSSQQNGVLSDSTTLNDSQNGEHLQTSPVAMLTKDDRLLVEKLVASLGKCVLGLQEAGQGSYEGKIWRRRLDAARRILDGEDGAI
ncbi:hypothetical protein B0O99DRAFT_742198 [Bisporella sp. PMI_857]|nr:hypothetical protein B0O99DRAFT_742198 [Bisporella sp. PMI_857]